MQLTLYTGRPQDCTGRLPKEIRTYDKLDALGMHYQRTDHGVADTMAHCHEIDGCLGVPIWKNLFLSNRQQTAFYLLAMPGDKVFKTKELSAQLNTSRLSFASPAFMAQYLDITPGSVSVMGLMNDTENHVQLLLDADILQQTYFACHPCINTSSLKLKTEELLHVFLPAVHHTPVFVKLTGEA